MNRKSICAALILTAILFLGVASVPEVHAQTSHGPRSPQLNLYYFADETSLYSALKAGSIDMSLWPLTSAQYRDAIIDPNIILSPASSLDMRAFSLNNNETIAALPGARSVTSDVNFRKALWCMVDRDYYTQVICGGFATPIYVPVAAPQREWVDATTETWVKTAYAFSIISADAFLNAGGFAQRAGDPNPYYNPVVPGSAQYWRGYPAGWPKAGQRIDPVVFSARVDDGLRYAASAHLRDVMLMLGIPVNFISEPSSSAFIRVMAARNYQIYSSGLSCGRYTTYLYDWLHTCRWMPGGSNFHVSPTSPGYVLETNPAKRLEDKYDLDFQVSTMWYAPNSAAAVAAAKTAQSLACTTYATFIPLWSSRVFYAYRNLYGVTNMDHIGIENVYTFLSAWRADGGTTLRVGHKAPPTQVNQIYSSWSWDTATMGFTQDNFFSVEPYNILNDQPWLAQEWIGAPTGLMNSPSSTLAGTWISPSLAYSSNDLYASTSIHNATQQYGRYGFTLPGDAIVERVEVGIEAYYTGAVGDSWDLNATISWNNGVSWTPEQKPFFPIPKNGDPQAVSWLDFTQAKGWASGDFSNTKFQVRVRAIRTGGTGGTVFLDWIPVRVHYSRPAPSTWTDPDDSLTKSMMRYYFRDDSSDELGDGDPEWIEPVTGNVLSDFTPQWLGGGYEFNCWYYDTEPASWVFTNYRDIKHIVCNSQKKFAEVYFDENIVWTQYLQYGRLIYAPLGVPGPGQYQGWKQQPLSTIETRTFTGPITAGTFLNTLVPIEGAAMIIPTRAKGSPVEVIELKRNDSVSMTKAATPQNFDPAIGLGASGDYSIVGGCADGPRIRVYQNIPSNVKLTLKYWARGNPAGYWPGNTNFQTTLAGTGPFYMTSYQPGAGGYAIYKANQHHFMETPPLGEIDWFYFWLAGRSPRDGYYIVDMYDATFISFAIDGSGNHVPTFNWLPSADVGAPIGEIDIVDIALLLQYYLQTFGSPPPNPPP